MSELPFDDGQSGPSLRRVTATLMTVGAALLALVAFIWAAVAFWTLPQTPDVAGPGAFWAVGIIAVLLVWWALALGLWGLSQILRRLDDLRADFDARAANEDPTESALALAARRVRGETSQSDPMARQIAELVQVTRDLRDVMLLSEHERNLRSREESRALVEQLERDIPVLLREHNWEEARHRVQQAQMRFPSLSAWDALANQVEQARMKFESRDIESATREVNDLIALSAWDRAALVAQEALHRHPRSEAAAELVRKVGQQREKATSDERARLMARAQDATNRRDWTEALRFVNEILERFPKSIEARDLRQQLPTLQANAEIQTRQRMEAEIRELIQQRRFNDALRKARTLVGRYPDSPQAAALQDTLKKLEERAGMR
jgi:outer membrane protein assembly factor BamD (BamD/ComL family)